MAAPAAERKFTAAFRKSATGPKNVFTILDLATLEWVRRRNAYSHHPQAVGTSGATLHSNVLTGFEFQWPKEPTHRQLHANQIQPINEKWSNNGLQEPKNPQEKSPRLLEFVERFRDR